MIITQKEAQLFDLLQQEVDKVINLVMRREAIHRKNEGRITVSFSGLLEHEKSVTVTLDSYLMSDFDLKTSWTKPTLEKTLLRAIGDVRLWGKLEKDSVSSNFPLDNL